MVITVRCWGIHTWLSQLDAGGTHTWLSQLDAGGTHTWLSQLDDGVHIHGYHS